MIFTLLTCLLLSYIMPSRGTVFQPNCEVTDAYPSPFVVAQTEKHILATGCLSQEVTPKLQEVHVFNLHNGNEEEEKSKVIIVDISLKPKAKARQLVVYLNSQQPVVWKLKTTGFSNTSRHLFFMAKGSRMQKGEAGVQMKIKKLDGIPAGTEDLQTWVRRRHRTITSYTEVAQADRFVKTVGIDTSAPERCIVAANFHSPASQVFYLHQDLVNTACAAPWNQGYDGKDVHVIELSQLPASVSPSTPGQVELEIRTKSGSTATKYLVLLLRAHTSLTWVITAKGIRGTIDIFTDKEVDTDQLSLRMVRVASEEFTKEGQLLVDWAKDKYGPAVSYTRAREATRVTLYVDGADGLELTPPPPTEDPTPKRPPSPFDSPSRTLVALKEAMAVNCHNRGMTVTIRKPLVQLYGVQQEHLSLLDTACTARTNDTHFILDTKLGSCLTTSELQPHGVHYHNAVKVNRPAAAVYMMDDEEEDLAPPNLASGMGLADPTHSDDEDFRESDSIQAPFSCDYQTGLPPSSGEKSPLTQSKLPPIRTMSYQLDLFTDGTFSHKYQQFKVPQNQRLFIQATVNNEPGLRALIKNCWLATSTRAKEDQKTTLIHKGCKANREMQWEDGELGAQHQRFSFKPSSLQGQQDSIYLSCEIGVCSLQGQHSAAGIRKCVPQEQYCFTQQIDAGNNAQQAATYTQVLHLGPIQVISGYTPGELPQGDKGKGKTSSGEVGKRGTQNCGPAVVVEGLDSGTVIGIAFAAFFIGVLLTAALWFIHTHTGPVRRHGKSHGPDMSGETTPSSSSPIA